MHRTVRVELADRSYDVHIAAGELAGLGEFAAEFSSIRQVVLVSDSTVAMLYGEKAMDSLMAAGLTSTLLQFPAGEASKTLATMGSLYDQLFATRPAVDRDCLVVALGGGVTGDMAGFLAATALRGLRWIQCPTTLLAAVDASVGGKTGIDHEAGKNLIGAFHQPLAVLMDVETLSTLPAQELRSGLAECVKHAMIRDATLLDFLQDNAEAIIRCQADAMVELIARNVAIKASVVSADERETSVRAHLNFGHTIGHGIEAALGFGRITHGEAVGLGMVAACAIAEEKGLVNASLRGRMETAMKALGLATRRDGLDAGGIWRIMQHDKKARAGRLRFVLPTALGQVDIFDDVMDLQVRHAIEMLCV